MELNRTSLSRPRPRRGTPVLVLLLLLGVAACGGDDGDPGASGAGSSASASSTDSSPWSATAATGTSDGEDGGREAGTVPDGVCAAMAVTVFQTVTGPGEEEEAPDEATYLDALGRLADSEVAEVAGPAGEIEAAVAAGEGLADADAAAALVAMDRLLTWGAAHCPVDGLVWGCVRRSGFTPVGPAITDDGATPPEGDAATPEAAVSPEGEVEGERIEVGRTDVEVVFAWRDERGLVVRTEVAVAGPDGWAGGATTTCDDPSDDGPSDDDFDTVGGPIDG